ncbi:hypothetical protein [Teredinibacter sp. KSP-S5-2]|uniref:hypothetical protein n=1 Tax=Teredinibacter sp. KSP-S5-2 TaxID=3034506 RepID=UPI0029344958|nr:hypothetical protein [Teredinibacter sp. KSP-S5-2]WNO11023.1 hypothetical protein P5V12_07520 [Teredinibacter sp. KSP-S5-2]
MFHYTLLFILLCACSYSYSTEQKPAEIIARISTDADNLPDYLKFVDGRKVADINHYSGPGSRRDVIETVLLLQALDLGGFNHKVEIVTDTSYKRILRSVETGSITAAAATVWGVDLDKYESSIWKTAPLIRKNEFIVGFYTSPKNVQALSANSLEKLLRLSVVSNPHWVRDWETLIKLGFKTPFRSIYWPQMVKMVSYKRADMTLAPFQPTDDMYIHFDGFDLIPIPGVKVALDGTRHWAVSKKDPLGEAFYNALEIGLKAMRKKGTIVRAYEECGFFNTKVKDWKLIQPATP